MAHKFGKEVLLSIKEAGGDPSVFQVGEAEDDEIILKCNASVSEYKAAEMIHLYIEHWAKVNAYKTAHFDENRLDMPDENGRIFDSVFYDFYRDEECKDGIYGIMFVFDVTEPFSAGWT